MNQTQPVSSEIRMFMLLTGQHVIGRTSSLLCDGYVTIESPAEVVTKRNTHGPLAFALYPLLPNELLDRTDITIPNHFIIGEMTPSNALKKFYDIWALDEYHKLIEFKSLYDHQISKLGETYSERCKLNRDHQQKTQSPIDSTLSDTLSKLFDQDNGWGDPSVTH